MRELDEDEFESESDDEMNDDEIEYVSEERIIEECGEEEQQPKDV